MQQQDDRQNSDLRLAAVIPFRPLRSAAPSMEEAPPAAPRRLTRSRRLWGREDGFTVSGSRI